MVSDQDIVIMSPCHLEAVGARGPYLIPLCLSGSSTCLPSSVVWALLDPAQLPCLFFFFFHQCGFICPVCSLAGPEQAHGFPAWKLHPETLSDTSILESRTLDGHY